MRKTVLAMFVVCVFGTTAFAIGGLKTAFASGGSNTVFAFGEAGLSSNGGAQKRLQEVKKIYVGEMGKGDEAARFRLLLQDELSKRGFTVVESADAADGVLTGALSVRVMDDKSQARAYMTLATPSGDKLWSKDFGSRIFTNPFKHTEPVKLRAQDVAKGLSEDSKK